MGGPSVDERSFRQGARERCAGFGTSAGVGPGARGLARGLDSTVGIGTSNEATRTQRRFRTRVQGGGRRASVIGMGTWNVRRGRAGRLSLEKFQTSARER